jgi:hypothetical protein
MKEAITSEVAGKDPQKCFQQLYDHWQKLLTTEGYYFKGRRQAQVCKLLALIEYIQWLRLALSKGPKRIGVSPHLRTETDPVSETSCLFFFLVIIKIRTLDKVRNPSNSVCIYLASSVIRIAFPYQHFYF